MQWCRIGLFICWKNLNCSIVLSDRYRHTLRSSFSSFRLRLLVAFYYSTLFAIISIHFIGKWSKIRTRIKWVNMREKERGSERNRGKREEYRTVKKNMNRTKTHKNCWTSNVKGGRIEGTNFLFIYFFFIKTMVKILSSFTWLKFIRAKKFPFFTDFCV